MPGAGGAIGKGLGKVAATGAKKTGQKAAQTGGKRAGKKVGQKAAKKASKEAAKKASKQVAKKSGKAGTKKCFKCCGKKAAKKGGQKAGTPFGKQAGKKAGKKGAGHEMGNVVRDEVVPVFVDAGVELVMMNIDERLQQQPADYQQPFGQSGQEKLIIAQRQHQDAAPTGENRQYQYQYNGPTDTVNIDGRLQRESHEYQDPFRQPGQEEFINAPRQYQQTVPVRDNGQYQYYNDPTGNAFCPSNDEKKWQPSRSVEYQPQHQMPDPSSGISAPAPNAQ